MSRRSRYSRRHGHGRTSHTDKPIFFDHKGRRWKRVRLAVLVLLLAAGAAVYQVLPKVFEWSPTTPLKVAATPGDAKITDSASGMSPAEIAALVGRTNTPVIGKGPLVRMVHIQTSGYVRYAVPLYSRTGAVPLTDEERLVVGDHEFALQRYGQSTVPKQIALTFDDGPDPTYTPRILDMLARNNVQATFFVTGTNVVKHPAIVGRTAREGHVVANHTFNHVDFEFVGEFRAEQEINQTKRVITAAAGMQSSFFRLPYAGGDEQTLRSHIVGILIAQRQGYIVTSYNFDSDDWSFSSGVEQIFPKFTGDSLVALLHDAGGDRTQTIAYAEKLIQTAKAQGYRFVTLNQMYHQQPALYSPAAPDFADRVAFTAASAYLVWPRAIVSRLFFFTVAMLFLSLFVNVVLAVYNMRKATTQNNFPIHHTPTSAHPGLRPRSLLQRIYRYASASPHLPRCSVQPSKLACTSAAAFAVGHCGRARAGRMWRRVRWGSYFGSLPKHRYKDYNYTGYNASGYGGSRLAPSGDRGSSRIIQFSSLGKRGRPKRYHYHPLVSIAISAYNEEDVLQKTVESILSSHYKKVEMIIVNDGSKDDTGKVAKALAKQYRKVRAFDKPNGGKASGLNYAVERAKGEVVIAIDADTVFPPETVERLVRHFADPAVGAVAGNVKVGNIHNVITRWQMLDYMIGIHIERNAQAALNAVLIVPGACGAWRKSAITAAGGYKHVTLAEDFDLTLAVHKQGLKVLQDNDAISYTEAPSHLKALSKQRYRWMYGTFQGFWKHRDMFFKRRYGWAGMFVMPLAIFNVFLPVLFIPVLMFINIDNILTGNWQLIAIFFVATMAIQALTACIAVVLAGERWRHVLAVPFTRLVYSPVRTYLLYRTMLRALRGAYAGAVWNTVRTGTVVTPGRMLGGKLAQTSPEAASAQAAADGEE